MRMPGTSESTSGSRSILCVCTTYAPSSMIGPKPIATATSPSPR